ncbi:hypothetical protein AXK11_01590 [Cephaloticoccus primus]|uniref:UDP-glucose 4-epimerase n=1 Tax=Cephaloticoccus primus TaxID=1548207 RepID=A0A139STG2_9BACT|nr:NAD-dependent epimerase/dehydratase family protein [Cephaloticoccus primus]KXU37873.1 hypothetical protein AXK11_01590 [Cephaloticoccus primus]
MAKILITGAAGFIGSHTADRLLADGHTVLGVDNFRTGHRKNLMATEQHGRRFKLAEADVAKPGALAALCARFRPDAIIHLAALVSVQESIADPALNHRLNVEATERVAAAALTHGVRRIVFASSAAVYGDACELPIGEDAPKQPISPYGEAKLRSEELLLAAAAENAGLVVRCQRYFNVFGPRQDPASPYSGVISVFERCYREGRRATLYGDGLQTRDFISVYDVACANALAATRGLAGAAEATAQAAASGRGAQANAKGAASGSAPGIASGVANICTGRATSLLDIVQIFETRYPRVPPPRNEPARSGDIVHSLGNPARARAELGFKAREPFKRALTDLIDHGRIGRMMPALLNE